jgi:hypothetical protein
MLASVGVGLNLDHKVKIYLREVGCSKVNWIGLIEVGGKWGFLSHVTKDLIGLLVCCLVI